jgi:hypothetical protein
MPSDQEHRLVPLGHAIGLIMREPDQLGWQIVVPSSVGAKAVHAIRDAPQIIGWRYSPDAHVRGPWKCLCDYCLAGQKRSIKADRLRASLLSKLTPEQLNAERDPKDLVRKRSRRRRVLRTPR